MVKVDDFEIVSADMTAGTGAGIVICRGRVAGGAIGGADAVMGEAHVGEAGGVQMAAGTLARVMIGRRRMTDDAILTSQIAMVKGDVQEGAGIDVAAHTTAGKMVGGRGMAIHTIAVADHTMVEDSIIPGGDGVAGGTIGAIEPVVGVVFQVAALAGGGLVRVITILVAVAAFKIGVTADQWKKAMLPVAG